MGTKTLSQLGDAAQLLREEYGTHGAPKVARASHGPGTFKLLTEQHKTAFNAICTSRNAKFDESTGAWKVDPLEEERLAYKLSNSGFFVRRWRLMESVQERGPCPRIDEFLTQIEEICHQHRLTFVSEDGKLKVTGTTRENMVALWDVIDGRKE